MSTQPATLARRSDETSRVAAAAGHLVDFRDGLASTLFWMAKQTADGSCPDAAITLARLLYVFGKDESYRRGVQITTLAGDCWGIFPKIGTERDGALALLRLVCHDTATAVRDELHRDSCLCIGGDKGVLRARNEKGSDQ